MCRLTAGIHVLNVSEVAQLLGMSERHLFRLERTSELPCRRRLSRRRTGYLVHELVGLGPECVVVQDTRMLSREQVAEKLGMNVRTVLRMVKQGTMPPAMRGRWLERDIDTWLLQRPRA